MISGHQAFHGDGVKDVAFTVENCRELYTVFIYRDNNYCESDLEPTVVFPWCSKLLLGEQNQYESHGRRKMKMVQSPLPQYKQ